MHLTFSEYQELDGKLDVNTFDQLIDKAEQVISNVTSRFYLKNDWLTDNPWRKEQYQKAIVAQIEFFNEKGSTSMELEQLQSFSIGRTSVGGRNSSSQQDNNGNSLVNPDIYLYLEGTGFLYRGVAR